MRPDSRIPLLLPLLAVLVASEALAQARFEGLGFLHARDTGSRAEGVSPDGSVVVGSSLRWRGDLATRWSAKGVIRRIGRASRSSVAYAASEGGAVVVGTAWRRAPFLVFSPPSDAFEWNRAREFHRLPRQPDGSVATDVSADGAIACGSIEAAGIERAVIWVDGKAPTLLGELAGSDGTSRALGISGDGSIVVGVAGRGEDQAFRWTAATGMVGLGTLPGHEASLATAVSADGSVVVGRSRVGSDSVAFRWTEKEGMTSLGDFPDGLSYSEASDVSGDGSRVIGRGSAPHEAVPFLWDSAHGMRRLSEVLTEDYALDLTGWTLLEAAGISDDGTVIVGTGYGTGGADYTEAWRAVIPAP